MEGEEQIFPCKGCGEVSSLLNTVTEGFSRLITCVQILEEGKAFELGTLRYPTQKQSMLLIWSDHSTLPKLTVSSWQSMAH